MQGVPVSKGEIAHPVLELLRRYRDVCRMAWAHKAELDGPSRTSDEVAFLPAALSLQETPPHPMPRRLAWLLSMLFFIALGWAWFGRVDIVAVAPGRIVVSERTKVIQPLESSVVKHVLVKDGDRVRAGQVLVELDPTMASADVSSVQEQYRMALSEEVRAKALLKAMDTGKPHLEIPPATTLGLDSQMVAQQFQSEWLDLYSKREQLQAEILRKEAELDTSKALLEKLESTLPLAQRRERDFEELVSKGFISGHATQDRARERIEMERDLVTQKARVAEAHAAVTQAQHALEAFRAEARRSLHDRWREGASKRAQLGSESMKALRRERLTQLRSPIDGVVQQLAVHSVGGVVTSAQTLMVVVPEADEVIALVQVANLDIGFVDVGQEVTVKLETFPYTKYGTISATVSVLGADAVTDERTGVSTYPATLKLDRSNMHVDGKQVAISPGMNVTAEIRTGDRRVIEYLLSPIVRAGSESLRER